MNITLDEALKISQIAFYAVAGTVAVLTFRGAKRGLLNTVNTEYQKRVMDRLAALADDLQREFDPTSPEWWARDLPVKRVVQLVNAEFLERRDEILKKGEFRGGIPCSTDWERLHNFVGRIRSDPFLPRSIRAAVVDLLANRADVIHEAHMEIVSRYMDDLAHGKHHERLGDNWNWVDLPPVKSVQVL